MLVKAHSLSTRTVFIRLLTPALPALLGLSMLVPAAYAEPVEAAAGAGQEAISEALPLEGPAAETSSGETQAGPPAVDQTPPVGVSESAAAPEPPPPAPETQAAPPPEQAAGSEGEKSAESHVGDEHERATEAATPPSAVAASTDGGGGSPLSAAILASTPPSGAQPTGTEVVQLAATRPSASSGPGSGARRVIPAAQQRNLIARRAEQRRCELSALGAPGADHCEGGWMAMVAAQRYPVSAAASAVAVSLGAAATGGGDDGDSAGGGRPLTPSPGPAPGGAGGGVAAGGGSGSGGLIGFLTLAGLLLLAAPHVLRRLRLSGRPYRTAFFVLIPERPG